MGDEHYAERSQRYALEIHFAEAAQSRQVFRLGSLPDPLVALTLDAAARNEQKEKHFCSLQLACVINGKRKKGASFRKC